MRHRDWSPISLHERAEIESKAWSDRLKRTVSDLWQQKAESFLKMAHPELVLQCREEMISWNNWIPLSWARSFCGSRIIIGYQWPQNDFDTWLIHVWIFMGKWVHSNGYWTYSLSYEDKAFEKFNALLQNEMATQQVQGITTNKVDSVLENDNHVWEETSAK